MADFPSIVTPRIINIILAQTGNRSTVSFGMKYRRVSFREYSPPIPAVVSINATEIRPILACLESTSPPHFLLIKTPIARPADVVDSNILFARSGLVIPSPGAASSPVNIARGVAIKPPKSAQWATVSRDFGPFFNRQRRKATPDRANIPIVSSVEITCNVPEDIITFHLVLICQDVLGHNIAIVPLSIRPVIPLEVLAAQH